MNEWNFDNDKPIFKQISDRLKTDIAIGKYPPGIKFPSVRDLALQIGVNPNTVQRALAELELEGVLESRRGDGRYTSDDASIKEKLLNERTCKACREFIKSMKNLGISDDSIIEALKIELETQKNQNTL